MSGAQQVVVMNQRSFGPLTYPKPVPANQYWATISRTEQTTVGAQDLSISANLFRFTSDPSPSVTILNQGVFISQVRSNQIGPINFQMTASGRAYVSTNFKDNSAPVTPSRIYTFDVSSGNLQSVTQFVTLVYSTTGSQRFAQWWDLAVNPSRTRMGAVVKYVATDTVDRYRADVRILSEDGLSTSASLFAQNPLNVNNFSQRCIAINPVDANIVAIGGHARTNTTVGYVWVYKNYGNAQEVLDTNIFANAGNIGVFALEWSYSGKYLFASSQSITTVYKLNFDTGDVTPVFSQSLGGIYLRGIWTAEDESVILGSSNNALVRTGDNFTFVSGPGGVEIGTQPALNYNGQYLFAASQGTYEVRVFEYDGPSFFDTAVVNFNNNRYYEANGSFPMFDGKTTTLVPPVLP